jgi:hypothetical protein
MTPHETTLDALHAIAADVAVIAAAVGRLNKTLERVQGDLNALEDAAEEVRR